MTRAPAKTLLRSPGDPDVRRYQPRVDAINALEGQMEALSDEALRARTEEFKKQLGARRGDR